MSAKSAARLAARRYHATSYAMFLVATKGHPALAGVTGMSRGRAVGKMWRSLSAPAKQVFVDKAKLTTFAPKVKVPRRPNAFATFTKTNYHSVRHLPHDQRLKAMAKLWKATKPAAKP